MRRSPGARPLGRLTAIVLVLLAGKFIVSADEDDSHFRPGNLVVSRSVYHGDPDTVTVGMSLPPNCAPANCVVAKYDGTYPTVWNNAPIDSSFGITSKIFLDQLTPSGWFVNTLEVPNSSNPASHKNQMVTSFSSKSELALNLSTDRQILTFMGYLAPIDAIDVSNSNTPAVVDSSNPVVDSFFRVVAEVDRHGHFQFSQTNAYSGNNGRAAILNNQLGEGVVYMAGNAGNGANPQPTGILLGAGAQILTPEDQREDLQSPGLPTPVGSFNITQLLVDPANPGKGFNKADKVGKDDNFRGLTVFDDVIYYTKGSGGNGVNTVYFVDPTGLACPTMTKPTNSGGVGLPVSPAALPASPFAIPTPLPAAGLPSNMCVLAGFPRLLAKSNTGVTNPFGLWFANDHTLYVADEGDGFNADSTLYTHAAGQGAAGLQKWVLDSATNMWTHVYTLQAGLDLGVPYTVKGYPTGINAGTGLPWSPATDGLRNITGRVNADGAVSIWAVTSTVSGNGDQGADPNKLVVITDQVDDATLPAGAYFTTLRTAKYGEVLRGVSFAPGTDDRDRDRERDRGRDR